MAKKKPIYGHEESAKLFIQSVFQAQRTLKKYLSHFLIDPSMIFWLCERLGIGKKEAFNLVKDEMAIMEGVSKD